MNAINVIKPYKHHGMWVFDDPRVGLVQEPFVAGADTMIDRVVATSRMQRAAFCSCSPPRLSLVINTGWTGGARKAEATGTTPSNSMPKAGFVRRCSGILQKHRESFTCKSRAPLLRRVCAHL